MNIRLIIIALVSAGVGALIGTFGYIWLVGGSATPSQQTTAPTLDVNAIPTLSSNTLMTQLANAQSEVSALQTQVSDLEAGNGAASVPEATEADITLSTAGQAGRTLYRIDQRDSRATFTLMETLQGTRTTVIGGTNDVAGDVIIDFENPLQSQVGTIRINARTLVTSEEMRNRALRAEILQSSRNEFEFIEFVPTELNGLPESVTVGETYSFEIVGNLTIINTTNPVTFVTTVTMDSEDAISGTATTTVLYADWGISVPDAVGVADVTDDVTLAIEFIARAVE